MCDVINKTAARACYAKFRGVVLDVLNNYRCNYALDREGEGLDLYDVVFESALELPLLADDIVTTLTTECTVLAVHDVEFCTGCELDGDRCRCGFFEQNKRDATIIVVSRDERVGPGGHADTLCKALEKASTRPHKEEEPRHSNWCNYPRDLCDCGVLPKGQ